MAAAGQGRGGKGQKLLVEGTELRQSPNVGTKILIRDLYSVHSTPTTCQRVLHPKDDIELHSSSWKFFSMVHIYWARRCGEVSLLLCPWVAMLSVPSTHTIAVPSSACWWGSRNISSLKAVIQEALPLWPLHQRGLLPRDQAGQGEDFQKFTGNTQN